MKKTLLALCMVLLVGSPAHALVTQYAGLPNMLEVSENAVITRIDSSVGNCGSAGAQYLWFDVKEKGMIATLLAAYINNKRVRIGVEESSNSPALYSGDAGGLAICRLRYVQLSPTA